MSGGIVVVGRRHRPAVRPAAGFEQTTRPAPLFRSEIVL